MVVCWEIVGRGLYVSFCLSLLSLGMPGKIAGLTSQSVDHRTGILKANVSNFSPSSERIEELWVDQRYFSVTDTATKLLL